MASHEGSRKRLKVSRTGETPTRPNTTAVASSSRSAADMAAKNTNSLPLPPNSQDEQALATLNTDIDAMRQLVTCKICDRLLYEPYSLSCGHTYCYSCLSQWLVSSRKKTCPDCRAVATQQPIPSYIIRELVLIFVSRSELLPDGETSEEHHNNAKEEAKIVADDKANKHPTTGGLFKGCFSRAQQRLLPIHDPGDGVDRCPACHWELEDGLCPGCGFDLEDGDSLNLVGAEDFMGSEISDDSSEAAAFGIDGHDDFLGDDDFEGDNSTLAGGDDEDVQITRQRHLHPIDLRSTSDEGSEDEEEDGEGGNLHGFVVDDDELELETTSDDGEDTDVPQVTRSQRQQRRRVPVVISDDDDEDDVENVASTAPDRSSVVPDSDSDEDARPIAWTGFRRHPGRVLMPARNNFVDSEDDSRVHISEDEDDHESSIGRAAAFSPFDGSVDDGGSEQSGYNSDQPSSTAPMYFDSEVHEEDSDETDEEDDGWGDQTPRAERQYAPMTAYRAENYPPRNNRHVEPQNNYNRPEVSRHQQSGGNRRAYEDSPPRQPHGRGVHPNVRYRQPVHPFQLGNTLAGINNYNQRNQQMRSHPNHHWAAEGSGRSGGGVGVHSSGMGGSNETIRPGSGRKRARALSVSSDLSYELAFLD